MNLGRYTSRNARFWGDRPAILFKDQVITFRQLDSRSNRLANALLGLGLSKGDRVAVQAWNRPELIELECALYKAGLVKVALNARLAPQEVVDTLDNAQASVLILDPAHVGLVASIFSQTQNIKHVFVVGSQAMNGWGDYEDFIARGADMNPDVAVTDDDLAVLHFTSGSTGKLKAAMQTVGNRTASLRKVVIGRMRAEPGEVLALAGPITHASGMFIQPFLFQGGTIALHDRFDPDEFLRSVQTHRAAFTFMVPTMVNMLVTHPSLGRYDLSALRQISYGGAPMAPARIREAWEVLGPKFSQGYGAGETTGGLIMLSRNDHERAMQSRPELLLSCGRYFGEGDLQLWSDEGQPVAAGEIGEIVVQGPDVFAGYWREPELTRDALRDGWLRTGDLARMDDEGFVYIVDRKKDMIISGGFNVYPTEVEQALYQHPAVYETCVVGVPDERWGESVKAVVVVKPGMHVSEADLIRHCERHLADFKKPRSVEIVSELPKNGNGKLARKEVKERYWKNADRRVA